MNKRYLDPKADLTFKKVFGEHPDLLMSLLNALLPFDSESDFIEQLEYLPSEVVPENPVRKNSIVDVRCKDKRGRQFIVEMQMIWTQGFMQRVMFNSAKCYVRQLDAKKDYNLIEPVYSLNLVNDIFEKNIPDFYHYYSMVHEQYSDKVIEGLHLIFVELPKFKPENSNEKIMKELWLRYLTEIKDSTRNVPEELASNPEIMKAVQVIEESAFTDEQLLGYDKFWDVIRTENTIIEGAIKKGVIIGERKGRAEGVKEGIKKGLKEGIKEGIKEGMMKGRIEIASNMKKMGLPAKAISEATGLSESEISEL